jgi:hypothetical protein
MDKRRELDWQQENRDGWLVFWIVVSALLIIGALFGHTATKWAMDRECKQVVRINQNETR